VKNLVVHDLHCSPEPLSKGEAEILVHAAGLNFRDVLNILDLDPTRVVRPLGLECAGVLSRVSADQLHLVAEEHSFGMANGCLSSIVRADASYQVKMPAFLGFEEASTLPILWNTVNLALGEQLNLRSAQLLLVHAAAGGVGLVAVQFGHRLRGALTTTAGQSAKVAHLHALGIRSVASSRDPAAFAFATATRLCGVRLHGVLSALTKGFVATSLA